MPLISRYYSTLGPRSRLTGAPKRLLSLPAARATPTAKLNSYLILQYIKYLKDESLQRKAYIFFSTSRAIKKPCPRLSLERLFSWG